jgi:hypothetical protein
VLDEIDSGARVDAASAANDSVGKDTQVLSMLVEEDNNALLLGDLVRDKDRDVRLILFGAEGKADGVKAKVVESLKDFISETS